jgi:pilus assembly protein CpaF
MEKELSKITVKILEQLAKKAAEHHLNFSELQDSNFHRTVEALFKSVLKENKDIVLNRQEQEKIFGEISSELMGMGPIDKFLKDPSITEIMVNGPRQIYIERDGRLELTNANFRDEDQLQYFIEKIISPLGRRINELEPYIDARLKDGWRVNVVRSPIASTGPIVTIRKFSRRILNMNDLINFKTLDNTAADFLKACVISRVNIFISGGAGSGKTTLLNVLAAFVPEGERIITIEDTREIHLPEKHVVFLEARPPTIEGKGEITIRDLLRNALHMRPDRIIIGEVRSAEVLDMIQAMNIGHEGSMSTFHANSPVEALDRLEVLVLMGSANISNEVAKRQIINALDLIIQTERFPDGCRKITRISEIIKTKEYLLQDIFILEEETGQLKLTGKTPTFYQKLKKKANYFLKEFAGS